MKYPKEYLEEIKTRLKVSTVVSKYVSLKKRGKEYVGLSPFKNEKTPSFTVNDEKEFYHCFATSEHGNIFDFLMKTQNFKFGEAVKHLANLAGMQPYVFSKQDEEREKKWKIYSSIFLEYVNFYHNQLLKNEKYSKARDYLKNRLIDKDQVKKFKVGFVEKNPNLFEELKNNYEVADLLETGLFYLDEKKNIYVERFRGRLIFPINNLSGQPIALGGRIIEKSDFLAKYVNSPETLFFKKGSNLYNLDLVRKLSNKVDNIFLVEGYMDVVGLSKNGIENAVANLGTSLTDKQIFTLYQFFNDIIICFDGDESGYKAALRAAENSIKDMKPEKQISFLFLPDQEDPDSFVNKNGKEYFFDYSKKNKISIHQFIFNHYKKNTQNNPSSMAIFEKKLRSIANTIKELYTNSTVIELDELTEGTACTLYKAKHLFADNDSVFVANCDQSVQWDSNKVNTIIKNGVDGLIATFTDTERNPKWSFAKTVADKVVEVAEKKAISDRATVGYYYWRNAEQMFRNIDQMIEANDRVNGEFYTCPVYNYTIKEGANVCAFDVQSMQGIGTPEDLEGYLNEN